MSAVMGSAAAVLRADPSRLDPVFARLEQHVRAGTVPAAALAVGDAQGEIRSATFAGAGRALSPASYFFLASVTKPIFATAFMRLVEAGLVELREPVRSVIPEYALGAQAAVTPWHLLTHTSGVPDIDPELIRRTRPSAAQMTAMVLRAAPRFPPGTRWEYCSASFYLLGLIIERLTGTRYPEFVRRSVFGPLGMQATFDPRRAGRPIVAVRGVGATNLLIRFLLLRYLAGAAIPGGGLFGTLDDLLRFGAATIRPIEVDGVPTPLRRATIDEMERDQVGGLPGSWEGEERRVHFGLGWGKPTLMGDAPGSPRVVSHGGATGTRLWIDPEAELVFVFFTNQWSADRAPETEALRGTYRAMGYPVHSPGSTHDGRAGY